MNIASVGNGVRNWLTLVFNVFPLKSSSTIFFSSGKGSKFSKFFSRRSFHLPRSCLGTGHRFSTVSFFSPKASENNKRCYSNDSIPGTGCLKNREHYPWDNENRYSVTVDKCVHNILRYSLDSDLSGGYRYPYIEQLGTELFSSVT